MNRLSPTARRRSAATASDTRRSVEEQAQAGRDFRRDDGDDRRADAEHGPVDACACYARAWPGASITTVPRTRCEISIKLDAEARHGGAFPNRIRAGAALFQSGARRLFLQCLSTAVPNASPRPALAPCLLAFLARRLSAPHL